MAGDLYSALARRPRNIVVTCIRFIPLKWPKGAVVAVNPAHVGPQPDLGVITSTWSGLSVSRCTSRCGNAITMPAFASASAMR